MARQIIWAKLAHEDRHRILDYWVERTQSKQYSRKLNQLFESAVDLIAEHPFIGRATDSPNIRAKVVRDYLIFYEIETHRIVILMIWDTRQDPKTLTQRLANNPH